MTTINSPIRQNEDGNEVTYYLGVAYQTAETYNLQQMFNKLIFDNGSNSILTVSIGSNNYNINPFQTLQIIINTNSFTILSSGNSSEFELIASTNIPDFIDTLYDFERINSDNYASLLDVQYKSLVVGGNDYTQVLKKIISDISVNGDTRNAIKFPNFNIYINETIILPSDKPIVLFGNGRNSTIISNPTTTIDNLFLKPSNVTLANGQYEGLIIRDLNIDCNEKVQHAIKINQAKETRIFRNFIRNFTQSGICLQSSDGTTTSTIYETFISNNYIRGGVSRPPYCIELLDGSTDNQIYDNVLVDCATAYVYDNGYMNQSYDNHVFSYPSTNRPTYAFINENGSTAINNNYIDTPYNGILVKKGNNQIIGNKFLIGDTTGMTDKTLIEVQAKVTTTYYNSTIANNSIVNFVDVNLIGYDIRCTNGTISGLDVIIVNNFPSKSCFINRSSITDYTTRVCSSTSYGGVVGKLYGVEKNVYSTGGYGTNLRNYTDNIDLGGYYLYPNIAQISHPTKIQFTVGSNNASFDSSGIFSVPAWYTSPFKMRNTYYWIDSNGLMWCKVGSLPTSETDGQRMVRLVAAPTSSSTAGQWGDVAIDSNYLYWWTGSTVNKRIPFQTY